MVLVQYSCTVQYSTVPSTILFVIGLRHFQALPSSSIWETFFLELFWVDPGALGHFFLAPCIFSWKPTKNIGSLHPLFSSSSWAFHFFWISCCFLWDEKLKRASMHTLSSSWWLLHFLGFFYCLFFILLAFFMRTKIFGSLLPLFLSFCWVARQSLKSSKFPSNLLLESNWPSQPCPSDFF